MVACPFVGASMQGMPAPRGKIEMRSSRLSSNSNIFYQYYFAISTTTVLSKYSAYISLFNLSSSKMICMFLSPFYCKVKLRENK